ncbi:MAG TPA: hypothetical protein VH916_12045, partial [Dehalococcoidia bacterium]
DGDPDDDGGDGPDGGGPGGPEGCLSLGSSVLDSTAIDRIDAAFLEQHDPTDPFSVAAAEAIRARRGSAGGSG